MRIIARVTDATAYTAALLLMTLALVWIWLFLWGEHAMADNPHPPRSSHPGAMLGL
jgi:hypothetical protein